MGSHLPFNELGLTSMYIMKVFISLATLVAVAVAQDGYANVNGVTSGGAGGTTTTVSAVAAFQTAIKVWFTRACVTFPPTYTRV